MTPGWPNGSGLADPTLSDGARRSFTRTWRGFAGVFLVFLIQPLVGLWHDDPIPRRVVGSP